MTEITSKLKTVSAIDTVMKNARTVVMAVFNRFGDGVIGGVICEEFAKKWSASDCRCLIVTSPQLYPYLKAICPSAEVIPLNRKNPMHWGRVFFKWLFQYRGFDVGLNPYSYGKESRRIARMGRWCKIYQNPESALLVNYYDRVRRYLELPLCRDFVSASILPENVVEILVCPESSEARRTLTVSQFQSIVGQLRAKWPEAVITVANSHKFKGQYVDPSIKSFTLDKSEASSLRFLDTIRKTDLVVSVDSGPLHIACAFGTPVVALFSSAHPSTVINSGVVAYPLRAEALSALYCEVLDCKVPVCMNSLTLEKPWVHDKSAEQRSIARERCPLNAE